LAIRVGGSALGCALAALCVAPATAAVSADGRWQLRGSGIRAEAVWTARDGAPRLRLACDHGDPVLVLHVAPAQLPRADQVALVADGTGMDYPLSRDADRSLSSRIALDAPILDRMLVARRFEVSAGGRTLATGSPGAALVRLVRACRALHWPREARMAPSDAGLAKK
jgi:hypothetical protein